MTLHSALVDALDARSEGHEPAFWLRLLFAVTILVAVGDASLGTVPQLAVDAPWFRLGGLFCGILFLLEWVARFWCAPELAPGREQPRKRYLFSFLGIVDLLAAGSLLTLVLGGNAWRDATLLLQLVALFKLARFATGLSLIVAVLRNEARSLFAALATMLVVLFLASSIMYLLERDAQPAVFSSIPAALWWGIVTMGTVGYGDMVPLTGLGRLFGGSIILIGVAMFAVPAGILATGFAEELKRRDFVVTWHAVAKVPLFSGLDAARIASIARLLKSQIVPERQVIIRRGEPADAMFFVMAGEVEVDIRPAPVRLGKGQFFGEIALVTEGPRTATVTAVAETRLLSLDRVDFHRLTQQQPELKAAIAAIAAARLKDQEKNSDQA